MNSSLNIFEKSKPSTKDDQAGKDYERFMCAFYALKLSITENITDFKLSTNNKNYENFDDISLEITFTDGRTITFLLQLKHVKNDTYLNYSDFESSKGPFSIDKCVKSFEKLKLGKNVIYILFTNAKYNHKKNQNENESRFIISKNVKLDPEIFVLNTDKEDSLLQFQTSQNKNSLPKEFCDDFCLFKNQIQIGALKAKIEDILKNHLDSDVYGRYIKFMCDWSLQSYTLTKEDVVTKLTELTLSPWIQTLSFTTLDEKFQLIASAIMNFKVTVIDSDDDKICTIWKNCLEESNFEDILKIYSLDLNQNEAKCIGLWYSGKVPLCVKVNEENVHLYQSVINFFSRCQTDKCIMLLGKISRQQLKSPWPVFQNLGDLNTKEKKSIYDEVIRHFNVSLQGRQKMPLIRLLNSEATLDEFISTDDLLKMAEDNFVLNDRQIQQELPEFYIKRSVSTVFVNTEKTIEAISDDRSCLLIINCDEDFKHHLEEKFRRLKILEISQYLENEVLEINNLILLSTKTKCSNREFEQVCKKSSLQVYVLQRIDDNDSILLLRKGNKLSTKQIMKTIEYKQQSIGEEKIFEYLISPLNIFVAPPGIGKSTLLTFLCLNCPLEFWYVRVNLINHIEFLLRWPSNEEILNKFLELSEESLVVKVKKFLLKMKRFHIFLDGLDEIDSCCLEHFFGFIKYLSSRGISVWVSSRENLRSKILQKLNIMPIAIMELDEDQQHKYIRDRLQNFYSQEEIEKIISSMFRSKDIPSVKQLLGIPLQIYIITENFRDNRSLFDELEKRHVFVLTTIYKKFFFGKKKFLHQKTDTVDKEKQIGYDFEYHLIIYQIPAVKSVLDREDYTKLDLGSDKLNAKHYLKDIKTKGDKFGIIKQVNKERAVFTHQTFAEYFACLWFIKNREKVRILKEVMFSEKYENLRYVFDIMLAEESTQLLAIIYKNVELFEQAGDCKVKDKGGRNGLHLISCYGTKYPPISFQDYKNVYRETDDYIKMVEELLKNCQIDEKDEIFEFDAVEYASRSFCLFVIEKILENDKNQLDLSVLFKTYENNTLLAYYATELGYFRLLSKITEKDPRSVLSDGFNVPPLLKIAVRGSKDRENPDKVLSTEANHSTVKFLLESTNIKKKNSWDKGVLDLACKDGLHEMIKILFFHNAKCTGHNTILHLTVSYRTANDEILEFAKSNNIDFNTRNGIGETPLHLACSSGDLNLIKKLVNYGADVHAVTNNGTNMLHFASHSRIPNEEIIKFFLDQEIDIEAQNEKGEFPLYLSVFEIRNMKVLLDNGANVNAVALEKKIAQYHPSHMMKIKSLFKFIEQGKDLSTTNYGGQTAMHHVCEIGNVDGAELLIERGFDLNMVNEKDENILHFTMRVKTVNTKLVQLLLNCGVCVNTQNQNGETPLHVAVQNSNIDVVRLLLEKADVSLLAKKDMNVLHYAAATWKQNSRIIEELIHFGLDVNLRNSEGKSPLQLAWKRKSFDNVKTLLKNNVDLADILKEKLPLHYVVNTSEDNSELIKLLVDNNIDVNSKNTKGPIPLHLACKHRSFENVKMLITLGADIENVTNDNMSILHYAVKTRDSNVNVISTLLKNNINKINKQNCNGETPLHIASRYSCLANLKILLNNGASILGLTREKKTVLHYALKAEVPSAGIIKELIKNGVKINAQDCGGRTALYFADKRQLQEISRLLRDHQADNIEPESNFDEDSEENYSESSTSDEEH